MARLDRGSSQRQHLAGARQQFDVQFGAKPDGLRVGPFDPEHDALAFHAASEDAFAEHWGHVPRDFASWSKRTMTSRRFDPTLWCVVRAGNEIAGYVVSWWRDDRRTVGYWLGRSFWGRGVGTSAVRQFLSLEETRPLYADTDVGNVASRRLLERCGFRLIELHHDDDVDYVVLELT